MPEAIGDIRWSAIEVATGAITQGETLVRLSDVTIAQVPITRDEAMSIDAAKDKSSRFAKPFARLRDALRLLRNTFGRSDHVDVQAKTIFRKQIRLDQAFSLSYAEFPGQAQQGFGFLAEREGESLFCWEWFVTTGPGFATKLQEDGAITFTVATAPCVEEIVSMEFASDVSLRLIAMSMPLKLDPVWRVNILRGSRIFWPSLVAGELVANGFIS